MALSQIELEIAKQVKQQGGSRSDAMEVIERFRLRQKAQPKPIVEESKVEQPVVEEQPKTTQTSLVTGATVDPQEGVLTMEKLQSIVDTQKGVQQEKTIKPQEGVFAKIGLPQVSEFAEGVEAGGTTLREFGEKFEEGVTGTEIPFTKESKLLENALADVPEIGGETIEFVADLPNNLVGLFRTLKAITKKGIDQGPLAKIPGFSSSDMDKQIQDSISEGMQDFRKKVEEKGAIVVTNEMIQKDPLLVPAIMKSIRMKLARTGDLSNKQIDEVEKLVTDAESQVGEFLQPSKDITTRAAKKITPEILERDIKGTREQVLSLAKEQRNAYGKMIEDFEKIGLDGEINMNELDNVIDKFVKEANLVDDFGNPIAGQSAKLKALDDVMQTLRNVSKGEDVVDSNKFKVIRKAFDEVYKGTDASLDSFNNALRKEVADELRRQFSRDNPLMSDINKEFSFYANLDNVLTETIDRRFGKGEGGGIETKRTGMITTAGAGVGGALGFTIAGTEGAVIGGLIGRQLAYKLDQLMASPKWKLASAEKKKKLADAIVSGNRTKVENILDSIIVAQGLNLNDFESDDIKQEENNKNRLRLIEKLKQR